MPSTASRPPAGGHGGPRPGSQDLAGIRQRWIDSLVDRVTKHFWPTGADCLAVIGTGRIGQTARDPAADIASWTERQLAITRALLTTHIAKHDLEAHPAEEIATALRLADLVVGAPHDIVSRLIEPITNKVRSFGMPGPRWWDVVGWDLLLLELWTAERLTTAPAAAVKVELQHLWSVPEGLAKILVARPAEPYDWLPPALDEGSETGVATAVLRAYHQQTPAQASGAEAGNSDGGTRRAEANDDDDLVLIGRTDLVELRDHIRLFRVLERLLQRLNESAQDAESAAVAHSLTRDSDAWRADFGHLCKGLTAFEVELLKGVSDDDRYRDRCLEAGGQVHLLEVWGPDALPPTGRYDRRPAPPWIRDQILHGGARFWHGREGPYVVWLATAETDEHERLYERLLDGAVRLARWTDGPVEHIDLQLDTESSLLSCPFVFDLNHAESAWKMLLLASVGGTRLIVLRITEREELAIIGATCVPLPSHLREELSKSAVRALRATVGDDLWALRMAFISTDDDAVGGIFQACERAKGEDLLDDMTTDPPVGVPELKWRAFQEASRALARVRASDVHARIGHKSVPPTASLASAINRRARAREAARPSGPAAFEGFDPDLGADVLPADTAFVHLYLYSGLLGCVWVTRTPHSLRRGRIDLSYVAVDAIDRLVRQFHATGPERAAFPLRVALLDSVLDSLVPIAEQLSTTFQPLGIRHLIISPIAPMDLVPLHASRIAHAPSAPALLDVFDEIIYAPSIRILTTAARRQRASTQRPLLVAYAGSGHEELAGARAELNGLRTLYGDAEVLIGPDATPSAVIAAGRRASRLHIACHGYTSSERWANGLVLAGDGSGPHDVLTVADVLADGDLAGVDVAVLLACHTGGHRPTGPVLHTPRGLDAAFFARGAQSVVSTLWEVGDVAALVFASSFHTALDLGVRPARAYRRALELLRHGEDIPCDAVTDRACSLLDHEHPGWREAIRAQRRYGVWSWGALKFTGSPWTR